MTVGVIVRPRRDVKITGDAPELPPRWAPPLRKISANCSESNGGDGEPKETSGHAPGTFAPHAADGHFVASLCETSFITLQLNLEARASAEVSG